MGIADQSLDRVKAAYLAANELRLMLEPYNTGHAPPSRSIGRHTLSELDAQAKAAHAALTNIIPANTIIALAITGTATVAAGANRSLVVRATYADLSAAFITADAAWFSSNTVKVTVLSPGLMKGWQAGTSQITASKDGVISPPFTLTVT